MKKLLLLVLFNSLFCTSQEQNMNEKKIIQKEISKISTSDLTELIPFQRKDKVGYMYSNKKIAINPIFESASFFNKFDSIAIISLNNINFRVHVNKKIETSKEYNDRLAKGRDQDEDGIVAQYIHPDQVVRKINVICFTTDSNGNLTATNPKYFDNYNKTLIIEGVEYANLSTHIYPASITEEELKRIKSSRGRGGSTYYPTLSGLVDQNENNLKNFEFKFKTLVYNNYTEIDNKKWFFYIDKDDNSGFICEDGSIKMLNEFKEYPFRSDALLGFVIMKTNDKYGVLDYVNLNWKIKPQSKQITEIETINNSAYKKSDNILEQRKNSNIYFKIKDEKSFYYIDKNLIEYN